MKKVFSMMFSIILLLNVSLGYTLTIHTESGTTTRELDAGRIVTVGRSNRLSAKYVINSGNVVMNVLGNRKQFVMPEGNVEITITEKKTVADMEVGDYVTYYPLETEVDLTSLTGFEHETLNPSLTTEWRVLSKDATKVELISADSVGQLTLSEDAYRDNSGVYTTGSQSIMERSAYNYARVVGILDIVSKAYANAGVTNGWRGLGDNGTTEKTIKTSVSNTYIEDNSINGEPYINSNSQAVSDSTVLIEHDMLHSGEGSVWLASRDMTHVVDGNDTTTNFFGRIMLSDGTRSGVNIFADSSTGNARVYNRTYGVRPIISLKLDTEITGTGSETNKWVISEPSTYSIADMRIGDYVEYHPTAENCDLTALTGNEQNALIPKNTTLWRILSIDGTTIELISADSVGTLTLGSETYHDTAGTFTTGSSALMENSKSNFANYIWILNQISEAYKDNELTESSRGFGYNGMSLEKITTEISYEYILNNSMTGEPYSNGFRSSDIDTAFSYGLFPASAKEIWAAKRSTVSSTESDNTKYVDCYVNSINKYYPVDFRYDSLYYKNETGYGDSQCVTHGICPVLTLKSNVQWSSGNGASSSPFKLVLH